jgi:hypothetical protein
MLDFIRLGRANQKTGKQRIPSFPASGAGKTGVERVGEENWWLEFVDGDWMKQIADGEGADHRPSLGDT